MRHRHALCGIGPSRGVRLVPVDYQQALQLHLVKDKVPNLPPLEHLACQLPVPGGVAVEDLDTSEEWQCMFHFLTRGGPGGATE